MAYTNVDVSLPQDWHKALMEDRSLHGETPTERILYLIWLHVESVRRNEEHAQAARMVFEWASERKKAAEAK